MGVIDFHTHPYRPEDLAPGTRAFIRGVSRALAEHGDRLREPAYTAELLRSQGISRAVVLPEHCPATSGNVRTERVLEYCAEVPDFFLPFASVDPVTDAEPALMLRDYAAAGAVGLKLYPSYQFFYPNDRAVYPIYETCQELQLPLLLHIGSSVIPGTRMKFCDPIHLDDVAVDFPDLVIVMAHGGRGLWERECAFLAAHHANMYIDVTGLVPERLLELFPRLERLAAKVVFGSDFPAMPRSPGDNVRTISQLGLSPAALRSILHDTAARLLHLQGDDDADATGRA